jgi:hypothetical protein
MTTLIAVYHHGRCVARCDANCYNATRPACRCICRGRNHGVGFNQATENVRREIERIERDITDAEPDLTVRPSVLIDRTPQLAAKHRSPPTNQRQLF